MLEFASVSASSNDPAALVARLNEKAAEGWSVVSILGTGSDLTAFLSREAGVASTTATAIVTTGGAPLPVEEPAGWAVAPTSASTQQTTQQTAQSATQPTVPAMWAADPLNRFEMRYWDGTRWTEHVARAGQQYIDPLPQ